MLRMEGGGYRKGIIRGKYGPDKTSTAEIIRCFFRFRARPGIGRNPWSAAGYLYPDHQFIGNGEYAGYTAGHDTRNVPVTFSQH